MYKVYGKLCQDYALQSADNFMDVGLLVSLSIQQNWLNCGTMLQDVRENGIDSKYLWGGKAKTYSYLLRNKHMLFGQLKAIRASNKSDEEKAYSLMKIYLRIDGLGIPKAGFLCQLTLGLVGCMDSHNIKMYKLNPNALTIVKNPKGFKALETNRIKIVNYINLCHTIGTETLWDKWCDNLATKSSKWLDGNHVSKVHFDYLSGACEK